MNAVLPEMPVRIVEVEQMSGPTEIRCSSGGACGRLLVRVECIVKVVGQVGGMGEIVGGEERWECWTCWRAVLVRWHRPKAA